MTETPSALEKLLAIEEIKRLKAAYFRTLDTKDWAGFGEVFAPDCEFAAQHSPNDEDLHSRAGRDVIVASVRKLVGRAVTVHHGFMPEIDIVSADRATGIWAMSDRVEIPSGAPFATLVGAGHYYEEYICRNGRWMISRLLLTRLSVHKS
jgi:hypothetical protein